MSFAPTDAAARKALPLFSGVLCYFPDALLEVAAVSKAGNDQHNPGEPLHWAKEKSRDELDALARHLVDAGTLDSDGVRHSAKVAWRALANLQREIERERGFDYDPATGTWRKMRVVVEIAGGIESAIDQESGRPYHEELRPIPNLTGLGRPFATQVCREAREKLDALAAGAVDTGGGYQPMYRTPEGNLVKVGSRTREGE